MKDFTWFSAYDAQLRIRADRGEMSRCFLIWPRPTAAEYGVKRRLLPRQLSPHEVHHEDGFCYSFPRSLVYASASRVLWVTRGNSAQR